MLAWWGLDEVGDEAGRLGGGCWAFVVGDVPGFQFERKVAGVAVGRQRAQPGSEVRVPVSNAEADVARNGIAKMDMEIRP